MRGPLVEGVILEFVTKVRHTSYNEPWHRSSSCVTGSAKACCLHFSNSDLLMSFFTLLLKNPWVAKEKTGRIDSSLMMAWHSCYVFVIVVLFTCRSYWRFPLG